MKFFLIAIVLSFNLINTASVFAAAENFITIVNPVRGSDFWETKDQKPIDSVMGQVKLLNELELPATFLIRLDALADRQIIELLSRTEYEKGLFLEVVPSWTEKAGIDYNKSQYWHFAESVFLTGYSLYERERLIDKAFEEFNNTFGYYPKSVGAWWIDSYSLQYMQEKYGVTAVLIVANQYSTDNYQIWGQYWTAPYYPSKTHALHPAQSSESKLPLVMMQWAARDPVNGYGKGVEDSTYSVQVNDYIDYHNLDSSYFRQIVDIHFNNKLNAVDQLVIGLENSYSWPLYSREYSKILNIIKEKAQKRELIVSDMENFSEVYLKKFPSVSPEQIIVAKDPLGSDKLAVWYMNPYYRLGWFYDEKGSIVADLRQYIEGEKELCRENECREVYFATFATRVLDSVTYNQKWVIDNGKITNFKVSKANDGLIIGYTNEAGLSREIKLLKRDIALNDRIFTIDGAILNATKNTATEQNKNTTIDDSTQLAPIISWNQMLINLFKFIFFAVLFLLIPGALILQKLGEVDNSRLNYFFLSLSMGIVFLTLITYAGSILRLAQLTYLYAALFLILFIIKNYWKFKINHSLLNIRKISLNIKNIGLLLLVVTGTIFQMIPVVKSGFNYQYGIGFWGPNTHDGIWHLALINQLKNQLPPQNPIFSGEILINYHYFYDLFISSISRSTNIEAVDLLFRFCPALLSILLGVGTYLLAKKITKSEISALISVYLVYFAGSFGWIVEYIRETHMGGESAFWVNQSISFNLNPPFAVSLVLLIALIILLVEFINYSNFKKYFVLVILIGSLFGFKAYAAIIFLVSLFILSLFIYIRNKNKNLILLFLGSIFSTALFLLPIYPLSSQALQLTGNIFIFSPFWFIHSMVDSPDRVGWYRLSLARNTAMETGNWLKLLLSEIIGLFLFVVGNLGMRFIGLSTFLRAKTYLKDNYLLLILIISLISLSIPLLFIQSGNPWNTIQFMYYFLFAMSLFTGMTLSIFYQKIPVSLKIAVFLIMLLSPINSIVTASGYLYPLPHALINQKEMEALTQLAELPDGVVLTYPYDIKSKQNYNEPLPLYVYETTAYVSAFSKKLTFLEDEIQQVILGTKYNKRLIESNEFFKNRNPVWSNEFLAKNNIAYIYLPKKIIRNLDEEKLSIKRIFENDEVSIYERIK